MDKLIDWLIWYVIINLRLDFLQIALGFKFTSNTCVLVKKDCYCVDTNCSYYSYVRTLGSQMDNLILEL